MADQRHSDGLTLTQVAEAAGVSYDLVYRDVRKGILGCHICGTGSHGARVQRLVTVADLAQAPRRCYRDAAQRLRHREEPSVDTPPSRDMRNNLGR
jgi:hypothetical protein